MRMYELKELVYALAEHKYKNLQLKQCRMNNLVHNVRVTCMGCKYRCIEDEPLCYLIQLLA